MKNLFVILVMLCIINGCSKTATTSETPDSLALLNVDSSAAGLETTGAKTSRSPWIIPLTAYWKDPGSFILVIPKIDGTPLYRNLKFEQTTNGISDTLQGKILSTRSVLRNSCEPNDYYEVELGATRGWISSMNAYTIGNLDLGTFEVDGKIFRLGEMKSLSLRGEDEDCHEVRPIFLYDDSFIYLIDREGADPDESRLSWYHERHISLVDFPPGISIKGQTSNTMFYLTWGVPNGEASLTLEYDGDHILYDNFEIRAEEGDFEDGAETEGEDTAPQTVTCVLRDAGMGDCFHLEFDCGDFGSARTEELPALDAELWAALWIEDENGVRVNPSYKGKSFEITYQFVNSYACGDPSEPRELTKVESITAFKLH